jgi:hypothetical protein
MLRGIGVLLWLVVGAGAAAGAEHAGGPLERTEKPVLVLWAWDRAEDLRFLKPGEAEVAGLLATMYLRDGRTLPWPRRLPLFVPPEVPLKAVVRLESDGSKLPEPKRVAELLRTFAFQEGLNGLQIDFDARESQRAWYAELLRLARSVFPSVSMTALASWCLEEPWFASGPGKPDEAVPMLFRMGPERSRLLERLRSQGGFAKGCEGAVGYSIDEPLPWLAGARRVYVFHPRRWTREAFDEICARWQLR